MKTIFMPEVYKPLLEKFGRLPYCLTTNSYIYGGAIRDVLAGKEIKGDLDITTPSSTREAKRIIRNMRRIANNWSHETSKANNNQYKSMAIIGRIVNLKNKKSGALSQIIIAKSNPLRLITPALKVVKEVDIVCCGVALDCFGNVHEMVPNAIEHCKSHIISATKGTDKDSERYKKRVQKLRGRGWKEQL